MKALLRCLFITALVSSASLEAQIQLTNGDAVQLNLAASTLDRSYFVDLPQGVNWLKVELTNASGDFDLFLRSGNVFTPTQSFQQLLQEAEYVSIADDGNEHITIFGASTIPVSAGEWHLALLNFDPEAHSATLRVSYGMDVLASGGIVAVFDDDTPIPGIEEQACDTDPWFSNAPFTPTAGNPATTLGEARRNAMNTAMANVSARLPSPTEIYIRACWREMGGDDEEAVLASAGPRNLFAGFRHAPEQDTWFVSSVVARLSGTEICRVSDSECDEPLIVAVFNSDIDSPDVIGSTRWDYSLDLPAANSQDVDFVTVAMHEVIHGLGFLSVVDNAPEDLDGTPASYEFQNQVVDIFSFQMEDYNNGDPIPFSDLDLNERESVATSLGDLRWRGPITETAPKSINPFVGFDNDHPQLYAPLENEPGSSISHLSPPVPGSPVFEADQLMLPVLQGATRSLGLAEFMMADVGWDPTPKTPAVAVDAYEGFLFARSKSGHGMELRRAGSIYNLIFYTYTEDGSPDWYIAQGDFSDGVFSATTIFHARYDASLSDPVVFDSGLTGHFTVDFRAGAADFTCSDGIDRSDAQRLALFDWEINDDEGQWCIEPLDFGTGAPNPDFNGTWYAGPADTGWGMSVGIQGGSVFVALYYYDALGQPRFAIGSAAYESSVTIEMVNVEGYCRSCPVTELTTQSNGTVTLTFMNPSNLGEQGNTIDVDVNYLGTEGGTWQRSNSNFQLLSVPVEN